MEIMESDWFLDLIEKGFTWMLDSKDLIINVIRFQINNHSLWILGQYPFQLELIYYSFTPHNFFTPLSPSLSLGISFIILTLWNSSTS